MPCKRFKLPPQNKGGVMSPFSVLTISCPHCGQKNSITTGNLPLGTLLGCSHCGREVARWQGSETGFAPAQSLGATPGSIDEPDELAPML
jgi:DNA-directed RNA polymerase subunit RPC12/RpoP